MTNMVQEVKETIDQIEALLNVMEKTGIDVECKQAIIDTMQMLGDEVNLDVVYGIPYDSWKNQYQYLRKEGVSLSKLRNTFMKWKKETIQVLDKEYGNPFDVFERIEQSDLHLEQEILVSVVMPTYNRAYCIERSIKSVLCQTYTKLELIVVDDASIDDTEEIIRKIHDPRLRYVKLQNNAGANHARNIGIREARGKYIAFNDSDDEWRSDKLEKQMQLMLHYENRKQGEIGCVYCFRELTGLDGTKSYDIDRSKYQAKLYGNIYSFLLENMFISTTCLLIPKHCLEEVGFFREEIKRLQDWELLLRIAKKYKFDCIEEELVDAYEQTECITHDSKGWIETLLFVLHEHELHLNNIRLYRAYAYAIFNVLLSQNFDNEFKNEVYLYFKNDGILSIEYLEFQREQQKQKYLEDNKTIQEGYQSIKNKLLKLIENGYEVMLFHQGFGECALFMQLLYKYKEKTSKKIILVVYNRAREDLMKANPYVDVVIRVDESLYKMMKADNDFRSTYGIKDFLELHYGKEYPHDDFKNEICDFLGIARNTTLTGYPFMREEESDKIVQYMEKYHCRIGRTVYLVPHAITFGDMIVPMEFWDKLVERLLEQNYDVLINSDRIRVKGAESIMLPIRDAVNIAIACGNIVGLRTGFTDLVAAFSDIKIQVLYPDDDNIIWQLHPGFHEYLHLKNGRSKAYISNFGVKCLAPDANVEEYIYSGMEEDIENILKGLDKNVSDK